MEMNVINPDTGEMVALERTEELGADLSIFHSSMCKHPETYLCQAKASDGRAQYRKQCLTCGRLCGSAQKQLKPSEEMPDINLDLQESYDRTRQGEYDDILRKHIRLQRDQDSEWRQKYNEHLRSQAWREKRSLVLKRANGLCEGCFKNTANEVHHKTYRNVCNEFLFELVALCASCHERLHNQMTTKE